MRITTSTSSPRPSHRQPCTRRGTCQYVGSGLKTRPYTTVAANVIEGTDVADDGRVVISVMLAVADAPAAFEWYKLALGAKQLWNLGSVIGMEIAGAPIFLGEPERNGWETPLKLGLPSVRVEMFCDDPDAMIARAVAAGAQGDVDPVRNHQMPWGTHRQGGFIDPFGHRWLVGDRSPLERHP